MPPDPPSKSRLRRSKWALSHPYCQYSELCRARAYKQKKARNAPARNHRKIYKNLNKTIETASMAPPLLNSGRIVMNNNFSNSFLYFPGSVVLLSQSLQFPKRKKNEIKRFFYFSLLTTQTTSRNVKRFPMTTQRPQTTAHPVVTGRFANDLFGNL